MLFRQGDVLVMRVNSLPEDVKPVARQRGRVVLADGEVTGHQHAIVDADVELFETAEAADRWLRVGQAGAVLTHEEHAAIPLAAGNYLVRIQREYQGNVSQFVAD